MNILEKLEKLGIELNDEAKEQLSGDFVSAEEVNRKNGKIDKLNAELEKARQDAEALTTRVNELAGTAKTNEDLQKEIAKLNADLENEKSARAKREEEIRVKGVVSDFLSKKKFVNDITKDAFASKLEVELGLDTAKGKSLEEIFTGLITDENGKVKAGYLVDDKADENRAKVVNNGYSVGANNNTIRNSGIKANHRLTIEERMKLNGGN